MRFLDLHTRFFHLCAKSRDNTILKAWKFCILTCFVLSFRVDTDHFLVILVVHVGGLWWCCILIALPTIRSSTSKSLCCCSGTYWASRFIVLMLNSGCDGESWPFDSFGWVFPFKDEHLSFSNGWDDDHPWGHLEDIEDPLSWCAGRIWHSALSRDRGTICCIWERVAEGQGHQLGWANAYLWADTQATSVLVIFLSYFLCHDRGQHGLECG